MWQEYLAPTSLEQALAALADRKGTARVIAGGTDLALQARQGESAALCAVDVTGIPSLAAISRDGTDIVVGACVTHAQAAASELLRSAAPVLAAACASVGSPQIRNAGTIGGNVVNAQPAADAVIALLALDAVAEVASPDGVRHLPLAACFAGPGRSAIEPTREVVTRFRFKAHGQGERSSFGRLARRQALSLPMLNVAVVAKRDGGRVAWARIALGPVAPTPFRATRAEESLRGAPASAGAIAGASDIAAQEAQPRDSVLRGGRDYRKRMVRVLVRRALAEALGLASETA